MRGPSPPAETVTPVLLLGTRHPLISATDLAKKQCHWEKFGKQNILIVDLAQSHKAASDKKVAVEMGSQYGGSFTPSTMVEVKQTEGLLNIR